MTRAGHRAQHAHTADGDADGGSILGTIWTTLAVIACLGVLAGVAGSVLGHYRLDIVLSGSMKPAYGPGDLIYATQKPTDQLRPGDVLLFKSPPEYGNDPVTHRVVSAKMSPSGVVTVRTKGDNNAAVDPWNAAVTTDEVWVVEKSIPKVGYLAHWSKTWWPLLLAGAVALPMASAARRRVTESRTPGTDGDGATGRIRPAALLWFAPALIVLASGGWVAATGAGVVESLSQDARTWKNDRDAPATVLLTRFTLGIAPDPSGSGLATTSDDRHTRTVDGIVQHALTVRTVPARHGLTLSAVAEQPTTLTAALSVHVESCTQAWTPTRDGFTCPGSADVLVGSLPLQGTTITLADADQLAASDAVHLLLELRVPPDAGRSAAGQSALLDVRVDAARH